jgi:hypothetical protein
VIGRVLKRGKRVQGVLRYLYSAGKNNEHVDPRVIGSWRHPISVEPPVRGDGKRDFRPLTALLEQALAIRDADRRPKLPVWHCVLRAAPGDRILSDAEWLDIVRELMHRTGLSVRGREGEGVRWVAVCHGDNHVHVVAIMARQDGQRAHVDGEYIRVGQAARWAERTYKLHVTGRADGTADRRPTRAEQEKARRAGRRETPRVTLRRKVQAAAATAGSEAEFFAGLEARGVQVRLRPSTVNPGEITGYAAGLPGDVSASGGQVWYGGGNLAPDMSLPKLRTRWTGTDVQGPGGRAGIAEVYARAAEASRQAAGEIRAGRRGAADTARAAADLLAAAADVTGNPELRKAADVMSRAARAPWRRIPAASDNGRMLRAAARVLAASRRHGIAPGYAVRALLLALVGLAQALAELRAAQDRLLQAAAAREASARLAAVAASVPDSVADAFTVVPASPASRPSRGEGTPGRAGQRGRGRRPGRANSGIPGGLPAEWVPKRTAPKT